MAIFSWALGELTNLFFEFVLQTSTENQFIPDFLRLVGYPIFILGLIMQWRIMEIQVKKLEAVIILALFGLCLIAILVMLNIPILLDSKTITESLVLAIYPAMDLLLTFFSVVILWKVKRKKLVFPWIILTLLLANIMVINWQTLEI